MIDRETEARFAARGCGSLADPRAERVAVRYRRRLDRTRLARRGANTGAARRSKCDTGPRRARRCLARRAIWRQERERRSLRGDERYAPSKRSHFVERTAGRRRCQRFHLLGTSGTVTTLAGVHLGLERYDRWRVDGLWLTDGEATRAIEHLRAHGFRRAGRQWLHRPQRADLVLAGCAIFEAIRGVSPPRARASPTRPARGHAAGADGGRRRPRALRACFRKVRTGSPSGSARLRVRSRATWISWRERASSPTADLRFHLAASRRSMCFDRRTVEAHRSRETEPAVSRLFELVMA